MNIAMVFFHGRNGTDTSCHRIAGFISEIKEIRFCHKILIRKDIPYEWDDVTKYDEVMYDDYYYHLKNYDLVIFSSTYDGKYHYECKNSSFEPYWISDIEKYKLHGGKIICYIGSRHESSVYWGYKLCQLSDGFIYSYENAVLNMKENSPKLFYSSYHECIPYYVRHISNCLDKLNKLNDLKDVVFVARQDKDKNFEAFQLAKQNNNTKFNLISKRYKNTDELLKLCEKSILTVDFTGPHQKRRMQNCQIESINMGCVPIVLDTLDPTYKGMIGVSGGGDTEHIANNFLKILNKLDNDIYCLKYESRLRILRQYMLDNYRNNVSFHNLYGIINACLYNKIDRRW